MRQLFNHAVPFSIAVWLIISVATFVQADEVTYQAAQKVLVKYCAGCHNANELNGEFALDTFESLNAGGESGNALTPGSAASSRMIQLMLGRLEPKMPPDGEPTPTADEIQFVADWIDAGAIGPDGSAVIKTDLNVPQIKSLAKAEPITALAFAPDELTLAVGKFQRIEILDVVNQAVVSTIDGLPGKVTALRFSLDGKSIFLTTGVDGLYGEALEIRVATNEIVKRFRDHRDMAYALDINVDQTRMVTAGYDRRAIVWDLETGEKLSEMVGHSGAIFSAAFDATGTVVTTASADGTVKVWRVLDGERLDTRSEPLKEQTVVAISPDNGSFIAAGEDNRIRKWKLDSIKSAQSNELLVSRFAHESTIRILQYDPSGDWIVSGSRDNTLKIWSADWIKEVFAFPLQKSFVQAVALAKARIAVGRNNGSLEFYAWPDLNASNHNDVSTLPTEQLTAAINGANEKIEKLTEVEPNDGLPNANILTAPFQVSGTIAGRNRTDQDLFKFHAQAGEVWIIETAAQQIKSPLDTQISVFDAAGNLVPRVKLQAVRDSYFTFRGKNSTQIDDFRIQNWEEMRIGQLLYCNGEVVRLYLYPRGPDSGFNVFPNFGNRHTLFDTTALTHALNEPLYVVEAFPPQTELVPSGLPTFLINFENDDDSEQEIGSDSRLTFTAPVDGDYFVRLRDARDFQGDDFKYELTVRHPNPRFKIRNVAGDNPSVFASGYRKLEIEIDRIDGFDEPVEVTVSGLPSGFSISGPTQIEPGQLRGWLAIHADPDAPEPAKREKKKQAANEKNKSTAESIDETKLTDSELPLIVATAKLDGQEIRDAKSLGQITLDLKPKLQVQLSGNTDAKSEIPVIEIRPGSTTTTKLSVTRIDHRDRINFGKENAGINFPFGVYVDNTGLNGVLIPPGETERTIYLTAESFVQPGERWVFLEAEEAGRPASNGVILRVVDP